MIEFCLFWAIYPKKVAKIPAQRAWNRISADKRRAAYTDIQSGRYNGTEKAYIPNAATYLNQERWEDEIIEQPRKKEEWETMPHDDDKLIPWARKWGFPEAREGENYYQYRQKLTQNIKQRLGDKLCRFVSSK